MTNILSGIVALIMAMVSCTSCTDTKSLLVSPEVAAPSKDTVPAENSGEASDYMRALTAALAEDADTAKNTVYSPLSLYAVLAMLREGADGETLREIDAVLGSDGKELGSETYAILSHLLTLENTVLHTTNSVWVDDRFTPNAEYLEVLAKHYMAECFKTDLPNAEKQVNSYISEHTNGLIKNMLDENALDGTVMALMNTLYLDAEWQSSFSAESTHKPTFNSADGTTKDIDFMYNGTGYQNVIDNDYCIGVAMPYKDGSLSFVAVMPKDEEVSAAELTKKIHEADSFNALVKSAVGETTRLYIPKFKTEYFLNLKNTLKAMGINEAFTDSANFAKIANNIKLDTVLQKAVIEVDEKGTEAAAVTIAIMKCTSAAPVRDPRIIEFNRPFSYAVVDTLTGAVLFCGEYNVG